MRHAALCFVFVGITLAGGARADENAAITLRTAADLLGTSYTLGDIADIETSDPILQRRLADISIGAVPRQGYTELVPRVKVEAVVRQTALPVTIEWLGPSMVRIRGFGQRVEADALFDAAVPLLYGVLSREFTAIELLPVAGLEGVNIPAGTVRLTARVPTSQRAARRMSVLVDVSVDGKVYTTVPVWFFVQASRSARRPGIPSR